MSTKTLSNKHKLIVKKRDHLSVEKVSHLNSEQTKVQLELLEQAFDIYNKEFEQLMLTAEDEKIDTYRYFCNNNNLKYGFALSGRATRMCYLHLTNVQHSQKLFCV